MTNRYFYKTTITIEVLSEGPIPPEMNLEEIVAEGDQGNFSIRELSEKDMMLDGKQAAKALSEQGSAPEFFRLDEKGNDLD